MQVIPVIDIRKGEVVRALGGRRDDYRPLVTPLAHGSGPLNIVAGLRARFAFNALYVADLDAIEGRSDNRPAIDAVIAAFPDLRLWVDAGARDRSDLAQMLAHGSVDAVIGSESFRELSALGALRDHPRVILSLDFKARRFLGDDALLKSPGLWPPRLIVMTLDRVGAAQGPDLARLAQVRAAAPGRAVFAAGGVRDARDLAQLEARGVAGALASTALHNGALL